MRNRFRSLLIVLTLVAGGCGASAKPQAALSIPIKGAAATVHPLATQAAIDAMQRGGNAVDAAVAAAVTLGVVDGHNSGIGGGCFMLIRTAKGELIALDGREMAPAAATKDMYIRNGKGDTMLSQTGALASGVPGSIAVFNEAIRRAGKHTLADALLPAAKIAEDGFPIDDKYAGKLARTKDIAKFPETARILYHPDGTSLKEGEVLKQKDLALTYRAIAKEGAGYFYGGEFSKKVETWMKANGGILTASDFADYKMKDRRPLVTNYRGYTIVGFPPPSSGGVHVAEILSIMENFDIKKLEQEDTALRYHVIIEAMKLAFADRAFWLGDPDYVKVPRGLIDPGYAKELSKKIDLTKAMDLKGPGTPPNAKTEFFDDDWTGRHTTHISTADAEGNVVAVTCTVNTAFGSKVIIPGTGVIMNNQMDDFSIEPGVANAFGLVGADANAVAPGKRPLSSMSPTIVLKDDKPVLTVGAAGGPKIITQVVMAISNVIDLGDDIATALKRTRVHHQWQPASAWIEKTADPKVIRKLEALGHKVEVAAPAGATQAIGIPVNGPMIPVHDPRVPGAASLSE